jgi:ADP-ribose pyrophosphatase
MLTPRLEHIEQVSDGWVKKYLLTYRMPDGTMHPYEMASRKSEADLRALLEANAAGLPAKGPDAVCIVARTPRDTLVMEREFRYPLNSWCIAFPAGLVDPGEDMLTCAARELSEETGYEVIEGAPVRALPQAGYSSTGMTDETVHVVFLEAERTGAAHTEPNELIEVFELPIADIERFLQENRLPIGTRAQLALEIVRAEAASA